MHRVNSFRECVMRRLVAVLLITLVAGALTGHAGQQQVRGQVVNRDGAPQECQVDFYGQQTKYQLASDKRGFFYLTNPRFGTYQVVLRQGPRTTTINNVVIDQNGLHPPTLVANW
jgi:hypothetical protein